MAGLLAGAGFRLLLAFLGRTLGLGCRGLLLRLLVFLSGLLAFLLGLQLCSLFLLGLLAGVAGILRHQKLLGYEGDKTMGF